MQQHDAIGVGAFVRIVHAPAVGGFGELLVVDQDRERLQTARCRGGEHEIFQQNFPIAHFTDLERHNAAVAQHTRQLDEDLAEAVAVSDRVVVMSSRPGRIIADLPIDLPRPRSIRDLQKSPRFHELYAALWSQLESGWVHHEG